MNTQDLNQSRADHPNLARLEQDLLQQLLCQIVGVQKPIKVLRETTETINEVLFELIIDETEYYVVRRKLVATGRSCLSPRELAIAQLIAEGFPNKAIGRKLNISPCTVSTYIRRIFIKLGVTSRASMVARLMQENVLQRQSVADI